MEDNNPADITVADMVTQLGGTPPEPEPTPTPATDPVDPNPAPTADPTPAPAVDPNAPTAPAPAAQQQPIPEPTQQFTQNKANEAFASLRVQNKQLADTLKGVAGILGVQDTYDEQTILQALQQKVIESQAQQQHVPVELLQKVQYLEQRDQQYTAMQRQTAVEQGFQEIRTKYNLSDQQLNEFATGLIQNNLNPLEKDVDLVKEYQNMHFDELLQAAVAKAVANEQSRAAAAAQTSTNPGSQQNNTAAPGAPTQINNVRDLATWFNEHNK